MTDPISTNDIGPSLLTNPTLGGFFSTLGIPPAHSSHDTSDHPGGRRFTSIIDSLPKEVKPLSPRAVVKRNMLLSGNDVHLHSAFQSQKSLPFPFLAGNTNIIKKRCSSLPQSSNIPFCAHSHTLSHPLTPSHTHLLHLNPLSLPLSQHYFTPGSRSLQTQTQPRPRPPLCLHQW